MTTKQGKGLSSTRVQGLSSVSTTHLECPICRELLWKPVACQTCEKPFCSTCIGKWLIINPNKCPNRCQDYAERKCPPLYATLLAELRIRCFYEPKGCQQILSYEALDKHEIECGFQPKRCSGCRSEIPKKDLVDHENQCGSIQLSCPDCNFVYQRQDAALRHTENICLKLQLRQMREETQVNKQELRKLVRQLADMQLRNAVPAKRTINFSDLPDATGEPKWMPNIYQGMQWTEIYYMSRAYVNAKYPISGYSSAFNSVGSSNISFFKDEGSLSSQYKNVVFTLVSITVCSAWKDGLELTITGYRQSLDTNTHNAVLLFCKPQVIFLQWENIDEVVFKCSGGTIHAETQELPNDNQVIITQLTLS